MHGSKEDTSTEKVWEFTLGWLVKILPRPRQAVKPGRGGCFFQGFRSQHKITVTQETGKCDPIKGIKNSLETNPKKTSTWIIWQEFKISIIKILNELKKVMHKENEAINKEKIF